MRKEPEFCPCGFEPMNGYELNRHMYHCKQSPTYHVEPKKQEEWVMISKEAYDKYKHLLEAHKRY